jgi:hypothetical protein
VLYSSVAGRPRYLSQAGSDNSIERADVNIATFSMNTQTTPTQISAPLNYVAGEGSQSSEYEIEIDGVITAYTTGAAAAPAFNLAVAVDGSTLGGQLGLGGVFLVKSNTYTYTVRGRIAIKTTGAGGTAHVGLDGAATIQGGANVGNTQVSWGFASNSGGTTKSFDTTSAHTITIVGAWDSTTNSGHHADTYRTRISRRM